MARGLVRIGVGVGALLAGCARPGLDVVDDGPDGDDTGDPPADDTAPVDTGFPEPFDPCALEEVEPNNGVDRAQELPTDVQACGTFQSENDADFWTFELTEEGWLGVDVDAFRIGSSADVFVTLSSDDREVTVSSDGIQDEPDVRFRMPSPPGRYLVTVLQVLAGGDAAPGAGDDFFYEIIATSTKRPVEWDVTESDNGTRETAQVLLDAPPGDDTITVFGTIDSDMDADWFEVRTPAAPRRVRFEVEAHGSGSPGKFRLELQDDLGQVLDAASRGDAGFDEDPVLTWTTTIARTLRVRVIPRVDTSFTGRGLWYTLTVTLEEDA